MNFVDHGQRTSRRAFLGATGALVAGALLGTGRAYAQAPVTIGVLLPQAKKAQALAQQYVAGMRLHLAQYEQSSSQSVRLVTQAIGPRYSSAREAAYTLLDQGAHLLTGMISPSIVATLRDDLEERQTVLIVSDAGANAIPATARHQLVFHHSLGYWQANWAMGRWAAQHIGKTASIVTSFYDSGYDSLYAFRQGFEAHGGTIQSTHVTGTPATPVTPATVLSEVGRNQPSFVYALYSGLAADGFLTAYRSSALAGRVPLVGGPFLAQSHSIYALDVITCSPWAASLQSASNRSFTAAYPVRFRGARSSFAVLGYDTAQLITSALHSSGGSTRAERLCDALETATWDGPRGRMLMDAATHTTMIPLHIWRGQPGTATGEKVMPLRDAVMQPAALNDGLRKGIRSGWIDPYLPL